MSLLEFNCRPLVEFDPSKKEHRRLYHEFVTYKTWGRSPFRFICPDDHGHNLVTMMQRSLIEYYVDKEFGKLLPLETNRKDVQKTQKLVDRKRF